LGAITLQLRNGVKNVAMHQNHKAVPASDTTMIPTINTKKLNSGLYPRARYTAHGGKN